MSYTQKDHRNTMLNVYIGGLISCILGLIFTVVSTMGGCSVLKSAQSAPANETITEIIADAGTAAATAEQMYQAGTIPQTAAARAAINDLGAAYNAAKMAYSDVLIAETQYHAAVNTQLAACTPASTGGSTTGTTSGSAGNCQNASQNATARKVTLDTANATLGTKVSVLTAKISAVKTYTGTKQ